MPFKIENVTEDRERTDWIRVGLEDMEVKLKHVGPRDQERLRQRLVRDGVLRKGTTDINMGREDDFFRAFARAYIRGWRNVEIDGQKDPEYDPDRMALVLGQSETVLRLIRDAAEDEARFFSTSDTESSS